MERQVRALEDLQTPCTDYIQTCLAPSLSGLARLPWLTNRDHRDFGHQRSMRADPLCGRIGVTIPFCGRIYEKTGRVSLLSSLLRLRFCSGCSADGQFRLCTKPRFAKSREEAAKGHEEIFETATEGAEQDVQEQPEEDALSEKTVLKLQGTSATRSSRHQPQHPRHRKLQPGRA